MPYMIVKSEHGFSVFKQDAKGKPTGDPHNKTPYKTKKEAIPLLHALYAAEKKQPVGEMDSMVADEPPISMADATDMSVISQADANYTPNAPDEAHACRHCAFWSGTACELIANEPQSISPGGHCDYFEGIDDPTATLSPAIYPTPFAEIATTDVEPLDALPVSVHVHEYGMTTVFQGKTPSVPTAPGVDIAALTSGDSDPVFVTMKIAEIGRVSKGGIVYDKALVTSIVDQINLKRVGGGFGHIKDEDVNTAFPLPDGLWVGATLVGEIAYGKAYIRDSKAADYVRDLKAVNGKLGTSIWGEAIQSRNPDGTRCFKVLDLERVDFAPPERASLNMGGEFILTSEMNSDNHEERNMAITKDQLAGVPASDLCDMLDEGTWEQVAQMFAKKKGKKILAAEMATEAEDTAVRISELTTQTSTQARELNTLRTRVAEYEQTEFATGVKALVTDALPWKNMDKADASKQALARSIFTQVHNATVREMNGKLDLALAKAKIAEMVESDELRPIIQSAAVTIAGGSAVVSALGKNKTAEEVHALLANKRQSEGVSG